MDVRHREVLIAVIREYVDSAEPVGSRALTKRFFPNLSPATIRNVMSDLEEMGYLASPHTSAGRIPTDAAYRFYVESFPPAGPAAPRQETAAPTRRPGLDGSMERASAHLSNATRLTGLLLAPPLKHTRIARVDLIPLDADRALAAVVTDAGWLTVRAITVDPPLREGETGVQVTIGEENAMAEMRDCTVITCSYLYRDQVLGILGVVGPRRLAYPEIISVVDETARNVTEALSRVRQDLYLPS